MSSIASHVAVEPVEADFDEGLENPEARRWLLLLGVPFIVGGALFGIAIGTNHMWMMIPAAIFGPGAMILGFTYLALTHDGNRVEG
jgi:hypothetical protein